MPVPGWTISTVVPAGGSLTRTITIGLRRSVTSWVTDLPGTTATVRSSVVYSESVPLARFWYRRRIV